MSYQFKKHYTRDQARALLPRVKEWLEQVTELRAKILKLEQRFEGLLSQGADTGGASVNSWVRALAQLAELLMQFHSREIQIKDLDRGLIDFPSIIGGKEVFLCWERGEEDIEFWHDLDSGYAGRERLES